MYQPKYICYQICEIDNNYLKLLFSRLLLKNSNHIICVEVIILEDLDEVRKRMSSKRQKPMLTQKGFGKFYTFKHSNPRTNKNSNNTLSV